MADVAPTAHAHRAGLTSFVGRRHDLAALAAHLRESRLVTLTGPGGVGKTRTALEVAGRATFPDGVHVAELASVTDPTQLAPAVATALGVADQSNRAAADRVIGHLRGRTALLLLDNCEHLLDAGARFVTRLLDALPGLRVLATSREPLGIAGEQVHLLTPLAVPSDADVASAGSLDHVPAVRLLVDRARAVLPGFVVTPDNREAVAQLCKQLDGMPLAIELAALRLRSLSVSQVVARLHRRFQLLSSGHRGAGPRHRSLRALIDWSHDLCGPDERLLWARLAVFPSAVGLEPIEGVCGFGELTDDRLLDAIDGLVGKSVLVAERTGERIRYRQFVTLREYGLELLDASGERELLHRRHRDHYRARAAAMVERWCGPHQAEDLAQLREDHPNLLAALAWSADTPGEERAGADLASLLRYHWIAGGFLTYGRRWLERLLDRLEPAVPERGHALWVAAWVALIQGDRGVARGYLGECARIAEDLGDVAMAGHAAHWRALLNLFEGDLQPSIRLYREAIRIHREVGDPGAELTAAFQLAMAQAYAGREHEALRTCREVRELSGRHGELWAHGYALWVSAICHVHLGERVAAREAITGTMEIERDFRDGVCTALSTEVASWVAAAYGHVENAAVLAAVAGSVWRQLGTTLEAFGPHALADARDCAARIEEALGAERALAIRERYANVTVSEAVALGLELAAHAGPPVRRAPRACGSEPVAPLTRREQEVATLIADGLSNKEIAERLTISSRTVDGHVERILRKLDFSSRTQVASWVAASAAG
ncbi:ATP-binding protein [Prauserella flavalba]|uniref:ATP-binding protein n=1 Tax=Prauserella flavalba TaxID=1477506 RepID=UPI001AEFDC56|nr:LuxR C-terminal-related transcriptional regulator [Prauserella flavalba]